MVPTRNEMTDAARVSCGHWVMSTTTRISRVSSVPRRLADQGVGAVTVAYRPSTSMTTCPGGLFAMSITLSCLVHEVSAVSSVPL